MGLGARLMCVKFRVASKRQYVSKLGKMNNCAIKMLKQILRDFYKLHKLNSCFRVFQYFVNLFLDFKLTLQILAHSGRLHRPGNAMLAILFVACHSQLYFINSPRKKLKSKERNKTDYLFLLYKEENK